MDSSRTMAEHLQISSAMICDLKATGKEVSEREQVVNMIRVLPDELEHWNYVKLA